MDSSFELLLDLARRLYLEGAVPEGLAIVREIFAASIDEADLLQQLPGWIESLIQPSPERPGRPEPTQAELARILWWLDPKAHLSENIRALTTASAAFPSVGPALARQLLHSWDRSRRPRLWQWRRRALIDLAPGVLGWEISSAILGAARRQGLVVPMDPGNVISARTPEREPIILSGSDTGLVQQYAAELSEHRRFEPASRLALVSAVTSTGAPSISTLVDIIRPKRAEAARIAGTLDAKGYPTEAVGVLVDAIDARAGDTEEWRALWERVEPLGRSRISHAKPPLHVDASPPEPKSLPGPESEFFFQLEGPQARRNQVVRGTDVDLHFKYEPPTPEALAVLTGKSLDEVKRDAAAGKDIELEVVVAPQGFVFREGQARPYQIASIKNGALTGTVCFRLHAQPDACENPGFSTLLTLRGANLYQAFIPISLVDALGAPEVLKTAVMVNKAALERSDFVPRDLTAFILFHDGDSIVSFRKGDGEPSPGEKFNDKQLATELTSAQTWSIKAADNHVFRALRPDKLGPASGEDRAFQEATALVLSTGAQLYSFLKEDEGSKDLISAIESLPDGAKISIYTDHAFIPWETLYPIDFFYDRYTWNAPPPEYQPAKMWGYRFEFETVLVTRDVEVDTFPETPRQPGRLDMRIAVGANVDSAAPAPLHGPAAGTFSPTEYYRSYCETNSAFASLLDNKTAVQAAFVAPDYQASLIYLLCHGQNNSEGMALEFTDYKPTPRSVDVKNKYPHRPVIFVNSCSIGAISPHVFTNYLRQFRKKHAYGMITSSFPLPTAFATAFGGLFLEEYRNNGRLGEILLTLRRQLLDQGNPLAFFYSLQCPLDVRRPENP